MRVKKDASTYQQWTKKLIKKLLNIWETKTLDQISKELGRDKRQVQRMVNAIRKEGYQLTTKRKNGVDRKMVNEVLKELNLI